MAEMLVILTVALVLFWVMGSAAVFCVLIRRRKDRKAVKAPQEQQTKAAAGSYEEKKCRQAQAAHWLGTLPTLEQVFIHSDDGLKLSGHFLPAVGESKKILLLSHGYRCSGLREWGLYADFYHRQGFHLMIPDHRAHGDSEGKYIGFGWLDRKDLLRWCDYLRKQFGEDCEILLHGISMGAAAVLLTGSEESLPVQVKGIIADCSFTSAWEEACYRFRADYHLPPFPFLYGADLFCRLRAGYSLKQADVLGRVEKIRVPVLFLHGDADTYVPTEMGYRLYEAYRAPKRMVALRDTIHANAYLGDREGYERAVLKFFKEIDF